MRVLIRADASREIGTGHVVRCLTLGRELRQAGVEVTFVSRDCPGNLVHLVRERGFGIHTLASNASELEDAQATRLISDRIKPDWLVVDHYELSSIWETSLRQAVPELLAIDDLDREHDCTLLLDQNWFGDATCARYLHSRPCRRLLGPRYSLLGPEYAILRAVQPQRTGEIGRVLVFFGGSDSNNQTLKALQGLSSHELAGLLVDVVLGQNYEDADLLEAQVRGRKGTTLYRNMPTLAGLISRADLALGAGGATTWERAALGLPAVVTIVADNQTEPSRALQAAGIQRVLGDVINLPDAEAWRTSISQLLANPKDVRAMSEAAASLTDGLGAKRVARAILAGRDLGLNFRPAATGDKALLLDWANDPKVRENSFSQQAIIPDVHDRWFDTRLADAGTLILIAQDRFGLPIGTVRFESALAGAEVTVSISIDACMRGLGLGEPLLCEAIAVWEQQNASGVLVAETMETNVASVKVFLRCGFEESAPRRPGARCFVRNCFHRSTPRG